MDTMNPIDLVGLEITPQELTPYLVEVELENDGSQESFLRVRETLCRVGIPKHTGATKELFQTCNILHKRGRYYIVHFKMMFMLDGRYNHLTVEDIARQNTIIDLLSQWGLIKVIDPSQIVSPRAPMSRIKVLRYSEAKEWTKVAKYKLGSESTDWLAKYGI